MLVCFHVECHNGLNKIYVGNSTVEKTYEKENIRTRKRIEYTLLLPQYVHSRTYRCKSLDCDCESDTTRGVVHTVLFKVSV